MTGTEELAADGVTTIGNMTYPAPDEEGHSGNAERRDYPGDGRRGP